MNEVELLINQYVDATVKYYMTSVEDYKKKNKYYDAAVKYLCDIKMIPNWVESFRYLLKHENEGVRMDAATDLLPYETKRAKRTLRKIWFLSRTNGFEAQLTLSEWNAGNLKFPIYENGKIVYADPPNGYGLVAKLRKKIFKNN